MWDIYEWMDENAGKLLDDHIRKGTCYGMSLAWLQQILQNRKRKQQSIRRKPTLENAVYHQNSLEILLKRFNEWSVILLLIMTIIAGATYYFHPNIPCPRNAIIIGGSISYLP